MLKSKVISIWKRVGNHNTNAGWSPQHSKVMKERKEWTWRHLIHEKEISSRPSWKREFEPLCLFHDLGVHGVMAANTIPKRIHDFLLVLKNKSRPVAAPFIWSVEFLQDTLTISADVANCKIEVWAKCFAVALVIKVCDWGRAYQITAWITVWSHCYPCTWTGFGKFFDNIAVWKGNYLVFETFCIHGIRFVHIALTTTLVERVKREKKFKLILCDAQGRIFFWLVTKKEENVLQSWYYVKLTTTLLEKVKEEKRLIILLFHARCRSIFSIPMIKGKCVF